MDKVSAVTISVPRLVRIKPGAIDRLGIYLRRSAYGRITLLHSSGLQSDITERTKSSLDGDNICIELQAEVTDASFEQAADLLVSLPRRCDAIVGLGGGKALDTAKYVAHLAKLPYFAIPTSLSNDGVCSPQSSLQVAGRRRSLAAAMPVGVVVDTEVCRQAPHMLWWSGVGDLAAKITAAFDWKLAFHARGEPVNDLALLLCDSAVRQFASHPQRDQEGVRLLATAHLLSGIAMEVSGSSRPASGSEHLISHALDELSTRPRLHGLQVGVAAYLVAKLQGQQTDDVGRLLEATGFWQGIRNDPLLRSEWLAAARLAPTLKPDFHTVLSKQDCTEEIERLIDTDPVLSGGFV